MYCVGVCIVCVCEWCVCEGVGVLCVCGCPETRRIDLYIDTIQRGLVQ